MSESKHKTGEPGKEVITSYKDYATRHLNDNPVTGEALVKGEMERRCCEGLKEFTDEELDAALTQCHAGR